MRIWTTIAYISTHRNCQPAKTAHPRSSLMSQIIESTSGYDSSHSLASDSDQDQSPLVEEDTTIPGPTDATEIPEAFTNDEDAPPQQEEVLKQMMGTGLADIDQFDELVRKPVKLSQLKKAYEQREERTLNMLDRRWGVQIDESLCLRPGTGTVMMYTDATNLDYHLTVANSIGLSALLPNTRTSIQFTFEMDLKKPYREFKGKHGMVGFDTRGRMLYIGKCMSEDVFLAMAPRSFISSKGEACDAGYSTGISQMSRRHSRMVTLMLLHFLTMIEHRSFCVTGDIYNHELDKGEIGWAATSSAM